VELKPHPLDAQLRLDLEEAGEVAPLSLILTGPFGALPRLRAADADTPLGDLAFTVVDVETTGTRPGFGDRVTEIAAVTVHRGRVIDSFESLVNPGIPISPWITRLTGISNSMVADAPRFPEICAAVMARLRDTIFVAHNARFDWAFLSMEVERASGARPEGSTLCTVRLARRLLPHLRRRSLDFVANHYGVTIESRHRAGGDAFATALVLTRLLDEAAARGCRTWGELSALVSGASRRKGKRSAMPRSTDDDSKA
jgi:DNA polymerase III subunit epsilon